MTSPISSLLSGDITGFLLNVLYLLPAIVIALSFHEAAHAWIANRMGDPTAKNLGRLTLDPTKHFTLFGVITLLTWRMHFTKRFSFIRAFKISFFVFRFSSMPLILTKPIKQIIFGDVDLAFGLLFAAVAGIILSLVSSLIAKSPKQYY